MGWLTYVIIVVVVVIVAAIVVAVRLAKQRKAKDYERSLKLVPMLIHLPPSTDDIQGGGRDERDVTNEALSQAQVMYSIIASTLKKGFDSRVFGQRHMSFEIVASNGMIRYYTLVPAVLTETVKQGIISAYPSARLEEIEPESIFSKNVTTDQVAGGELSLKKDYVYPISTYEDTQRDASLALLNAMSVTKQDEGLALQILLRPTDGSWTKISEERVQNIRKGRKNRKSSTNILYSLSLFLQDLAKAFWTPPEAHEKGEEKKEELSNLKQEEIAAIEKKTKSPGFETLIRVIASSADKGRSEAMLSGVVASFSQFSSQNYNSFQYDATKSAKKLTVDYIFRFFPKKNCTNILNSVELASIFHLPAQNAIPTSQVERQATKQVEGPAKLVHEGVILGVNEYRGEKKEIRLSDNDRRRHTYVIGATGMGKSVLLTNIAYQDMMEGRGFAFIDPHGDAAELLLSKVPEERIDDVVYFDPSDIEHPIGMNMFEWTSEDQKDFIVQEGISMLQSLFDPSNQGFFGPRGQHMFRNAALLLMSDPKGATFIDIPQCFTDPQFVKSKLKYVTDKAVYDYWTKEFPASQKSNDAGEVITWFASKWGPFLSNTTMRNILGQTKSGFNIREIMDKKKIFLVNLSKGKLGDINSNLLGMILVMKFQQAAMSRADIPEDERKDFCLFVDEFQNFATESFESILSEARKYRLNLLLANQFMTQLTDKIREAILGNCGTILCGRVGVTDAELMEKAFSPVFNAEDLHKQGNYQAIATVMMYNLPSAPFTMSLLPPMGEANPQLLETMKVYSATKYAKTRAEVETEIKERWASAAEAAKQDAAGVTGVGAAEQKEEEKKSFLEGWKAKKATLGASDGDEKMVVSSGSGLSTTSGSGKAEAEVSSGSGLKTTSINGNSAEKATGMSGNGPERPGEAQEGASATKDDSVSGMDEKVAESPGNGLKQENEKNEVIFKVRG